MSAAIYWPNSLPAAPLNGTMQTAPKSTVYAFEPEAGPPITRRNSTADVDRITMQFILTSAQRATFLTFYKDTCIQGSLSFYWDDPATKQQAEWVFDPSGPYTIQSRVSGVHDVSVSLIRLP